MKKIKERDRLPHVTVAFFYLAGGSRQKNNIQLCRIEKRDEIKRYGGRRNVLYEFRWYSWFLALAFWIVPENQEREILQMDMRVEVGLKTM